LTYKQDFSIIQDNNNKSDRQILLGKWDFQNSIKIDSDYWSKVSIIVQWQQPHNTSEAQNKPYLVRWKKFISINKKLFKAECWQTLLNIL
jgi:hypothetical protein